MVLLISQTAYSQGPPPPNPPGIPIDGGIFFLLSTAIIYGVTKIRNN
tara:strand:+ start:1738 stop:1878 length:141 start_codon:yes stop_codon:yes gene_type:complete